MLIVIFFSLINTEAVVQRCSVKKAFLKVLPNSQLKTYAGAFAGRFDLKKDTQPSKLKRKPRILVKLSFREFCDSNLFGLHTFDNIAVGTPFYARHVKPDPVFLPTDGEVSWSLLSSLVSLLSGDTEQPKNTYFCILTMTVRFQRAK